MRKRGWLVLRGVAIVGALALLAPEAVPAAKEVQTVTGKVMRARIHHGETLRVYIRDALGQAYLVQAGTPVSKELRSQVGKTIAARGYVKKSSSEPNFDRVIDVLEYELVEPPDTGDVVPLSGNRAG
jgi:hypothetical protein